MNIYSCDKMLLLLLVIGIILHVCLNVWDYIVPLVRGKTIEETVIRLQSIYIYKSVLRASSPQNMCHQISSTPL